MNNLFKNLIQHSIAGVMMLSLFGCGGGGSETAAEVASIQSTPPTSSIVAKSGAVGILLTDKPADPSQFTSINATIARVELISADSDEKVTIYSGDPKTVDLLRLKNESMPFSFRDDVPAGTYCKIRLILDDLELVLTDKTPKDSSDNDTYHPKLPGNGKLDLLARDCFTVEPGKVVTLQIDMDAGNSIHVVENKKGFNFRPVIYVDVLDQDFEGKLVRLDGEISEVDSVNNHLLLCGALPVYGSQEKKCARVFLGEDSAFFDNQKHAGEPRPVSELLIDERVGMAVSVVGWIRPLTFPKDDVEITERHTKKDKCLSHKRHKDDDESDDCDDQSEDDSSDDEQGDDNDSPIDNQRPLMALNALVVELGDFLQLEGLVATDADKQGFDMEVTSGPIIIKDTLAVALQTADPGVNGTRIVSKSGRLLDHTLLTELRPISVDGVLELSGGSDDQLKAALIIVDMGKEGKEQVTGTVLTVGIDSFTLSPAGMACGFSGDLVVSVNDETEYLTVTITEDNSEIMPGGVVEAGQEIGLSGVCENDGYSADNVVIVDDQRI